MPAVSRFVYLASQSPRRRQLLEQLGVAHELLLPGDDEDAEALEAPLPGEAPARYVRRVTGLKLDAALARLARRGLPPAPVLCSDTTVALGRTLYGKPADDRDAARMLGELAGRTHRVLTAVAIGRLPGGRGRAATAAATGAGAGHSAGGGVVAGPLRLEALSESLVTFEPLTRAQIARYVATGEPRGKAGAYAVQGTAAMHITAMRGSYSGIMGLPLHETAGLLRRYGLIP